MRRAGLVSCLVLLGLLGRVDLALGADVFVSDAKLSPAKVTIPVGGEVQWRSTGARSHEIASVGSPTFRRFTLASGGRVKREFDAPGVYRYRVDGNVLGRVVVVALGALPPPKPGIPCKPRRRCRPGEPGDPDGTVRCNTRKVYRYTISVDGRYEHHVSFSGFFAGSESADYHFFSAHEGAPVWVERPCYTSATLLYTVRRAQAGVIHVNINYANDQDDHPLNPSDNDPEFRPCSWHEAISLPTPALALLGISDPRRHTWEFGVGMAPIEDLEVRAVLEFLLETQRGNCGQNKPDYWTDEPDDPVKFEGLNVLPPIYTDFGGIIQPTNGRGTPPRVLNNLLAGRNASLNTGQVPWTYNSNRSSATPTTGTWSLKFVFQRLCSGRRCGRG